MMLSHYKAVLNFNPSVLELSNPLLNPIFMHAIPRGTYSVRFAVMLRCVIFGAVA